LNSCDLNIADGFGIKLVFWRYGRNLKCRLAGIDLMLEILKIASENNLSVFLAANSGGLSSCELTRDAIHAIYPSLEIDGRNIDINNREPITVNQELVFCNFGVPYQEKFINSIKNDRIRLAMGVGGSFDYLTGRLKRAPQFIRAVGFEWFWRLLLQPKRWKRIWNAVIVFPIKVIFNK
ncbi:MAG: WecB/TagA/CpsF family glycosyltransferase, partial [Candidatus Moranbacteria bacterium]|nr:WecB/TagA/CpsF family glycosyltransferase [Candidatus Moranbacteria bacterium]